jgi:K+-sensing histidine kinase KdpD
MKTPEGAVMSPALAVPGAADAEYRQLMSDLLHDLSQPLSTLTCLLEVNLLLPRSLKQVRHDLKTALHQAHSIARLFRLLRALWESGSAQQDTETVSLTACLRETVADLLPVAEAAKVKLLLTSNSACRVNFQPSRLRQAINYLIGFAIESSAGQSEIKITADEERGVARITDVISAVAGGGVLPQGNPAEAAEQRQRDLKRRLGLVAAGRIFEGGGGQIEIASDRLRTTYGGERFGIEGRLPLVPCARPSGSK